MYRILKAEQLADKIFLMDVEAPRVARACQPGEFVIVKIDEKGERIPLTICDYNREQGTENGATAGKFDLAKRAKAANLDAIHDTVHEMARDEARHGKAFEGLLKRYFG